MWMKCISKAHQLHQPALDRKPKEQPAEVAALQKKRALVLKGAMTKLQVCDS